MNQDPRSWDPSRWRWQPWDGQQRCAHQDRWSRRGARCCAKKLGQWWRGEVRGCSDGGKLGSDRTNYQLDTNSWWVGKCAFLIFFRGMYLDRIRINLFSTIGVWYMKAGLSMYCNNLQRINGGLLKWSIPESIFVLGFSIPSSCGSPIFFETPKCWKWW